jgi:hypothetical protein
MRITKRSCVPSKENLKFTIGARITKVTLQLAGDLRSIFSQKWVCGACWCEFLMKKAFPWLNRSFQTNFKFAVIINRCATLRAMQVAPLAACEFSALRQIQLVCAVPVATLCIFAMILVPCTFMYV